MQNLFQFAHEYNEFDEERTIIDIIEEHLDKDFSKSTFADWRLIEEEVFQINQHIDQFLRMFYMHTKVHGGLRPHKLDYWKNVV